jgi:hypothetical protein
MKFALEHQNPLVAGRVDGGDFYPERSYSLLAIDNPNVLLWALKPAEDGIEAGLVARVWNVSNEKGKFSISSTEAGLTGVLSLTHIETPSAVIAVQDGSLVDTINQQQIKTYAIFPATLPYTPNTTGLDYITVDPNFTQPTPTAKVDNATAIPENVSDTPVPPASPTEEPKQDGNGCFYGLLTVFGQFFK